MNGRSFKAPLFAPSPPDLVSRRLSRLGLYLGSGLALVAGITCADISVGPRTAMTQIGLAPQFTRAAEDAFRNLASFHLELDNIRVRLNRGDGSTAVDTVVAVDAGAESVTIELTVRMNGTEEQFNAVIDLRAGDLVLFSGTQVVVAKSGGSQPGPPVEVEYVGPGAGAVDVSVLPAEVAILSNQTAAFTAVAFDASEAPLPNILVDWSVRDPAIGSVSALGVFTPVSGARGSTWVIATLPTSVKDSARVSVSPIPTSAVLVSGGGQTAAVGQTISPFVFEVRAADQLPVPGAVVSFAMASGGGELSASSAVSGADGRVSVTMTLGSVVGENVVQLLIGDEVLATASASAIAGAATKLVMVQQPSGTATSGSPIAVQPKVRLQDAFGNNVPTSGVPVTATVNSAAAITLSGATTVNTDANGVAAFTDLVLIGLGGSATLTFSQGSLSSTTSSSIALSPSGTPALLLETSSSVAVVAGTGIEVPPSVLVKDANGNPQPGVGVRVMLTAGEATFYDQSITSDVNGRVIITSLPIPTTVGTYLLTASNEGYTGSPIEIQVVVQNAAVAQLLFVTEPAGVAAIAGALLPEITLELYDAFENLVITGPTAATAVTLSLVGGTAGAILGPNTEALTRTASAGRVTFNVTVDRPGTGYAVQANAGTVPPATSGIFEIAAPPAPSLTVVRGADQAVMPRRVLPDSVVVRALDASSNPMSGAVVQFAIVSGGGLLNSQSAPVDVTTDANGFAAVSWEVGAGPQSLTATMGAATETVNAFVADRIVVLTEPSLAPQSGVKLVTQPVVRFTDAAGRVFPASGELIEAALVRVDAGTPSGSVASGFVSADAGGIAAFTELAVFGPTTEQVRLRFFHQIDGENPDIAAALSGVMNVQAGAARRVEFADATRKRRTVPLSGSERLTFRVTDGFNPVPDLVVSLFQSSGSASCVASATDVTTDANGLVAVDVSSLPAFSSCRTFVQLKTIPDGNGPAVQLLDWQDVYAVEASWPLWIGGGADPAAWDLKDNWFDGTVPGSESIIFIPGAVDNGPRADRALALQTLQVEVTGQLDLNTNGLSLSANLLGGGSIINGTVTLLATRLGVVHANISGSLQVGPTGTTSCAPQATEPAYTVPNASNLFTQFLELNCALAIDVGAVASVGTDVTVPSVSSGGALRLFGFASVVGNASFKSGNLTLSGGQLSVGGGLTIDPFATLDQSDGSITVTGDASFGGMATLTKGTLFLEGNFIHTGNGDNFRFLAGPEHTTILAGKADGLQIRWDLNDGALPSTFGRLQIADQSKDGYSLLATTGTLPVNVTIADLIVLPQAKFTVDGRFILTTGGVVGEGVRVDVGGTLMNNGEILVARASCTVPKGLIAPSADPFSCLSP